MGLSKTDLFTDEQNALANLAKAFGHPARIAILQQMLKSRSCINAALVKDLGLAQATVSQHLKELKRLEIIQGTIEGNSMSYCIHPKTWLQIKKIFNNLFDQHDCCSTSSCC